MPTISWDNTATIRISLWRSGSVFSLCSVPLSYLEFIDSRNGETPRVAGEARDVLGLQKSDIARDHHPRERAHFHCCPDAEMNGDAGDQCHGTRLPVQQHQRKKHFPPQRRISENCQYPLEARRNGINMEQPPIYVLRSRVMHRRTAPPCGAEQLEQTGRRVHDRDLDPNQTKGPDWLTFILICAPALSFRVQRQTVSTIRPYQTEQHCDEHGVAGGQWKRVPTRLNDGADETDGDRCFCE